MIPGDFSNPTFQTTHGQATKCTISESSTLSHWPNKFIRLPCDDKSRVCSSLQCSPFYFHDILHVKHCRKKGRIEPIFTKLVLWLMAESLWKIARDARLLWLQSGSCVTRRRRWWGGGLSSGAFFSGPICFSVDSSLRDMTWVDRKELRPSPLHHFDWHLQTRASSWNVLKMWLWSLSTLLMSCYASS